VKVVTQYGERLSLEEAEELLRYKRSDPTLSLTDNVRYRVFIGQKYSNFSFVLSFSLSNESKKIKLLLLPAA
jgi:hypothetical protein